MSAATGVRGAWVTLLTKPSYLIGVRALRASLEKSGTSYPLVVMVTDDIDVDGRQLLVEQGCRLVNVAALHPADDTQQGYANARFAEVWTKLAAWRLTDFDRVVVLDADMLVMQNMDELFTLDLAEGGIAACHACRCNPNRIATYPASWTPQNCHYSHVEGVSPEPDGSDAYLNGGLLVLTPDEAVFANMMQRLAAVSDASRYAFAEQDFLNEYYLRRWQPLPYVYNALKTLPFQHPLLWDADAVKNIHYIIDKPWQGMLDPRDRYAELHEIWWNIATNLGSGLEPVESLGELRDGFGAQPLELDLDHRRG